MKRIITLIAAALLAATGAFAQFTENFNSRPQADLAHLKGFLQNHCWQFHDFDINNSWDPAIEGDGAMVSGSASTSTQNTGIISPLLSLNGSIQVSFKYKFSAMVTDQRWLKIYALDGNNNIVSLLDSINFTGANNSTVYTYNKFLPAGNSVCNKIYLNYQGINGDNRIAIDELSFGTSLCSSGGCEQPPVAVNDNLGGASDYTATGNVLNNDYDPANLTLTAHLVTNSADGNVDLQPTGDFTFTPNAGFKGNTTSFTYMACNNGTPSLCSDIATATIIFQANAALPVTIVDFAAAYANDKVNIKWTTTFELNNDHFVIEHSTDGITFTTAGVVKGQLSSATKHDYQFNDDVSKSVLNKYDMYYRLKQVDLDGNASYTKVLVVRVYRTKSLQSLSVTPNPAVNDIKVNVQLNENSFIVMKVTNSSGIEVMRKSTRGTTGTNSFSLDGSSRLQAGMYFLEVIINSNERMMVKLIKN
jgi:Bacterial Ig domain/Secretion system C-terminal sorting domain